MMLCKEPISPQKINHNRNNGTYQKQLKVILLLLQLSIAIDNNNNDHNITLHTFDGGSVNIILRDSALNSIRNKTKSHSNSTTIIRRRNNNISNDITNDSGNIAKLI